MNKVILMGRLTRSPEVRYSQGSEPVAVARYTLAVNRRFKRKDEPEADFIPCVAFGKSGEFAEKYFRIYLFFTFLNCVQPIASNLFTAIGKPKKGIFLSLTRQILFLLPLIVILPLFIGIDGIMYAGPIADFVAGVVALAMAGVEGRRLRRMESASVHA